MKIKTITYLLLIATIFNACSKCEETTGRTELVDQYDVSILFPFADGAKIKFLRNKKDTVTFQNLGLQTTYNYTKTQTDCPEKTPLEKKYMLFVDSVFGNSFYLTNYRTPAFNYLFSIIINDVSMANSEVSDFTPKQPVLSTIILGKKYDTVSVWNYHNIDSLIFKTKKYGVLKFTTNGNTFELIP